MQLGETIATYDVALALRGESGKFDVTSPNGETYHVTCAPNHSITKMEWSGNGSNPQPFLIRKVAEPVAVEALKSSGETAGNAAQIRPTKSPFLIDSPEEGTGTHKDVLAVVAKTPDLAIKFGAMADLELLFVESDPKTKLSTACVCLKSGPELQPETRITATCATFNELDAEIRRLHAQLDDIRYRARKKFYQAQYIVASA
jgi:hypothetical protein